MNETSIGRLDAHLSDSLVRLLESHDLKPRSVEPGPDSERAEFAATIGFTGQGLKGALVIMAGRATLRSSLPGDLRSREATDELLADWGGELANQLLGRLKNRLWASGVEIALGTPVGFAGEEIAHFSPEPRVRRRAAAMVSGELVIVELELECAPELELGEAGPVDDGLPDGDFSLF